MNTIEFLRGLAAHNQTTSVVEQERFVRRFEQNIANHGPLLLEADGGIGKTIGYLICAMREAQRKNLPIILTTSTVTNRDQIQAEYRKIVDFASVVGDPIANIPLFNYRSVRDYASLRRLEEVIKRLMATDAPKALLDQLYKMRARLEASPDTLLEAVMPQDIIFDEKTIIERQQLAAHDADDAPPSLIAAREEIEQHFEQACIIVMTQAMFAIYPRFEKMVRDGEIAVVIIDEVDKLTSMDFVTYTSLALRDLDNALKKADHADIDIDSAQSAFAELQNLVADIKSICKEDDVNVLLIYDKIGEDRAKALHAAITDLAQTLDDLGDRIDNTPATDWADETDKRRLLFTVDEFGMATDRLRQFMRLHGRQEWKFNASDLGVFLSWADGDEFRVVAARPGAIMEWLFRDTITVPVLLTTAFLGEPDRWFAAKISLPLARLQRESAIRAQKYGSLEFVYFTNLTDAIAEDSQGKRKPNPAHFDDIGRMLTDSPWAWKPNQCILVLTPGYEDISAIQRRLVESGSKAPVFAHLQGTNINEIRDKLIQSADGGILLTVYWEGFNIVANQGNRRGLVDVLVMSRIPYQQPNPMLENLYEHLGFSRHLVYRNLQTEAKRRIHQGFNRVIRGPDDKGVILICDSRFPPPAVLIDKNDEVNPNRDHIALLEAIPERFRTDGSCFSVYDAKTWEQLP